ncbi:MAG: acyl-CoA/acyl-ACP dehydrogenase, partial [Chloroflexi bacterium]|nr:acyl-CoA/acyl-ACP dehydrogenase [Chloroflexota bacterium]
MDLDLSEEQEMLRAAAREFLQAESPLPFARDMEMDPRGFTPELWQKIAQVGWLGLPIPEEYGGTGQPLFDLGLLMEEVGGALLPGPFFNTVLCATALVDHGSEDQRRTHLPRIVSGDLIATPAILEPFGELDALGVQLSAARRGSTWVLNGTKFLVENAHVADNLLVAARTSNPGDSKQGITLLWVDARSAGIRVEKLQTLANDNQCEVQFHEVSVPDSAVIGEVGNGWDALNSLLQRGAILRAFQMIGAFQQVLELTVEFVKNRVQFGRALGSIQVVQHACANMATDLDGARYATRQAMWSLSEGL